MPQNFSIKVNKVIKYKSSQRKFQPKVKFITIFTVNEDFPKDIRERRVCEVDFAEVFPLNTIL